MNQKGHLIHAWQQYGIIHNKAIFDAFAQLPRELFVLPQYQEQAYADIPLPILAGQTISQPTTVVFMLEQLAIKPGQKILEVGAGSGYNAALLGLLVGQKGTVISTEIIPELTHYAQENIRKAGIDNVQVIQSDGSQGYSAEAPYDRIIVAAAAPQIPQALLDQLKDGGILLIPVGGPEGQDMIRVTKKGASYAQENLGVFRFVPLTGKHGVSA